MAELVQLDKAASQVGKSEVTLRRLIKAEKIPFQKEKTLTGFIYLVDPNEVRKFYKMKPEDAPAPASKTKEPVAPQSPPVRIAIAGESGNVNEYWQKKSELYEDRYHQELAKHSNTREELGVWRGRAEQTQAMLMKLLPAPQDVAVRNQQQEAPESKQGSSVWAIILTIVLLVLIAVVIGGFFYLRTI